MTGKEALMRARELRSLIVKAAQYLEDTVAVTCPELYDEWNENGISYAKDYKLRRNGKVYKVIIEHTSQPDWPPETASTLFAVIDEVHTGTLEDPIPYDGNMELFNGKYYTQDGITYKCIRNTDAAVYHALKDLIGLYVERIS